MKLYKNGIVRNTENPSIIADLKKAGYVELKDEQPEVAPVVEPVEVVTPESPVKKGKVTK